MPITLRVDTSDVMRALRQLRREDAPFVTAYALTKTAQDIKAAEIASMKSVFDRPSRYTLNALYMKPAKKNDLVAEVYFKDGSKGSVAAWRYLGPQVEGGMRKHKSHELRLIRAGIMKSDEFVVPGSGQRLDTYGNVRGSDIERILSQLGAAEQWAGYTANATNSRRSKRKRRFNAFFVLRGAQAPDGIYRRNSADKIEPMLMFVRAPRYKKRFPFYETSRQVFDARFTAHAREGFNRFVASRMKKAA